MSVTDPRSSPETLRDVSERAPEAVSGEDQALACDDGCRDSGPPAGPPSESCVEHVEHARLDGKPRQRVNGLDGGEGCVMACSFASSRTVVPAGEILHAGLDQAAGLRLSAASLTGGTSAGAAERRRLDRRGYCPGDAEVVRIGTAIGPPASTGRSWHLRLGRVAPWRSQGTVLDRQRVVSVRGHVVVNPHLASIRHRIIVQFRRLCVAHGPGGRGVTCGGSVRPMSFRSQPPRRRCRPVAGATWAAGTPAITCLTCWPQPAQVVLPHLLQVTARHMMISPYRWSCAGTARRTAPDGIGELVDRRSRGVHRAPRGSPCCASSIRLPQGVFMV